MASSLSKMFGVWTLRTWGGPPNDVSFAEDVDALTKYAGVSERGPETRECATFFQAL